MIRDLLYPTYNAIYDKNRNYIGFDEEDMLQHNIDLDLEVNIIEEFNDVDGYKCVSIDVDSIGIEKEKNN